MNATGYAAETVYTIEFLSGNTIIVPMCWFFFRRYITKHLMSVLLNLDVSLNFVSGNIETLGKTKQYFPREQINNCILYNV
jgi:hypothetical protein